MKATALLMVFLAAVCGFAGAQEHRGPYEILKTAGRFTIGPIGFAATPSKQEKAFRLLMKGPKPSQRLKELLAQGTIAGQLYGLLGLKLLNDPAFDENFKRLASSPLEVETMQGCILTHATAQSIAQAIRKGKLK